jgi:hypothetical protein
MTFGGVWTNHDQDGARTFGRPADVGDVSRPGVLLVVVLAALWFDDDHEESLAGLGVVQGDDGVGREFHGDDVVQVSRAKPGLQPWGQRDGEGRPHELGCEGGVLPDQLQRRFMGCCEGGHGVTISDPITPMHDETPNK